MLNKLFTAIIVFILLASSPVNALSPPGQREVLDSGALLFNIEQSSVCNNLGIVNGGVDRFLQVLAYQESGGDPLADASPASSASGKYQYIDSTWQSRVSIYGPSGPYERAKLAPESIQDAVAYIEYSQKFRDLGGDLFKLAVSHFYPEALTNEAALDITPGNNSITPRQYANKFIENIGQGVGSNIALHYTEAPEFSTWLERAGGEAPGVNNASASGCLSSMVGGDKPSLSWTSSDLNMNMVLTGKE